ncbi:CehA/McbA family metallohydrolase [Verrucomicrobia bacterium]|nr:CehA/McbA family metallohydrolase [Verrucomicrobiota bacterium]
MNQFRNILIPFLISLSLGSISITLAQDESESPAFQPLHSNIERVLETMRFLGAPLPDSISVPILSPSSKRSSDEIQSLIDQAVAFFVDLNPEVRVKVQKAPGPIRLQQGGFTPLLVKIRNQSTSTESLRILSPESGPVYAGMSELSAVRMQRQSKGETKIDKADSHRFLEASIYNRHPMTERLSGLEVEYAIALIYARDSGTFEATIGFDVGQGNQDIGFRGEVPVLFRVSQGVQVTLNVTDSDGSATTGKFVFKGPQGEVYPPQAKRVAPDFYFQEQVYRHNGSNVILPTGQIEIAYSRGPEYRVLKKTVIIPDQASHEIDFKLERWIDPSRFGFYSGDHHIHGAGCAHYTMPTLGVTPADMFLQVKGEGLNVGCVLTWGPCFDFQRQFFNQRVDRLSEPFTLMKYDLEISGFGSAALGHVCLLNLKDQTYPNSNGTMTEGWPTWTTPVMRWAKDQGGTTGYAHSASGLQINPQSSAKRLLAEYDQNRDQVLTKAEGGLALLPDSFEGIDHNNDHSLSQAELELKLNEVADILPNLAIPEMNSVGAMEICVTVAAGVCDFISAMDTARIPEWNMWYHLLNCGFPLKVSGETDFPCMSGNRVGQGRVYVQLGQPRSLDFSDWCRGLAAGRSYVSDGFAHALEFKVNDIQPGFGQAKLSGPDKVSVSCQVAFAPETPRTVAQGQIQPQGGVRFVGDTVTFHGPPPTRTHSGGTRKIEIIVNGRPVASQDVSADGQPHRLSFEIPINQSSWVALRHFPQLHTNPVEVIVDNQPIRVSSKSARWCQETIKQLWTTRGSRISQQERAEAKKTFQWAIEIYKQIQTEAEAHGN